MQSKIKKNSRSILSLHSLSTIYPSTFTTVDVCPIDISLCRHFSCRPFTLSTFLIADISLCRHLIRRQKNLSAKNFSTKICRRYALDISLSTFGYFPSLSIHLSFFCLRPLWCGVHVPHSFHILLLFAFLWSTYLSCLSCSISSFHLLTSMSQSSSSKSALSFLTT